MEPKDIINGMYYKLSIIAEPNYSVAIKQGSHSGTVNTVAIDVSAIDEVIEYLQEFKKKYL